MRALWAAVIALASLLPMTMPAQAAAERELYLYFTHTRETIRIVYKRDGRFIGSALDKLNVFLRDWRREESTDMDPALFDLLWEVYQQTGASQPIHIVSAYRAPETNAMLAANSSGVADNSQHIQGKAIDFFIPGVPVSRIRELGFRAQVGGVGYYPTSGSPFVHLDTASVRAWPRMTEAQLRDIFPRGRTLHLPSNGRVLSQEGRQYAQSEWQRCHRVPCSSGAAMGGGTVRVANGDGPRTLWDMITGGDDAQPEAAPRVATAPTPAVTASPVPIQTAALETPPPARPTELTAGAMVAAAPALPAELPFQLLDAAEMTRQVAMAGSEEAPLPPSMSQALAQLRATTPSAYAPSGGGTLTVANLADAPVPQPRPQFASADAAPASLQIRPGFDQATEAASLDQQSELDAFAELFVGAVLPTETRPDAATANALASLAVDKGRLFAPELKTVTETMVSPASFSSAQFAFGDAPVAGAGSQQEIVASRGFTRTAALGHSSTAFGPAQTIWVHYDSRAN